MIGTIIAAVDGSEHGEKAVSFAAELARKHEARLMLVHALLSASAISDLRAVAERFGFSDDIENDLVSAEEAMLQTMMPGEAGVVSIVPDDVLKKVGTLILEKTKNVIGSGLPNVETLVSDDDPAAAIVKCAEDLNADIVVIGSRGFGRVKGLMLGSVSQKVLQDVRCACLIVK
ncbi:MAG: universal stress protein [Alphaproteobacteria bacterium]